MIHFGKDFSEKIQHCSQLCECTLAQALVPAAKEDNDLGGLIW